MNERLDIRCVRRAFNQSAKTYDQFAVLQREIAGRLLEQLDLMLIEPGCVLDVGARTGGVTRALQQRYSKARVVSMDLADGLLRENLSAFNVCSMSEALPIRKQSVDMIVSNLNVQWSNDSAACFREFQWVLKPNGLVLFSMLGRETLCELRGSFGEEAGRHVHAFMDMHDVGDQLMQCGFLDPVMNMERVTLEYSSLDGLFEDLKKTGARNANVERPRCLMGKKRWRRMIDAYESFRIEGGYPASFEIIYGHAWQGEQVDVSQRNAEGETLVSVDSIRRS